MLVSLLAEPLTGLADTFFLARLGSASLAALGIATALLSGVFWVFNFLGIGTQTEVARSLGAGNEGAGREATVLSLVTAGGLGVGLIAISLPFLSPAAHWMGARGEALLAAEAYLEVRLIGAPAVLAMLVAFGALRGLQDMKTPLWIALASNAVNVALDPLLIFGWGPVPAFGVAGAAWASVVSQWGAALWAVGAVGGRLGFGARIHARGIRALFVVGRDLVLRTGVLLAFHVLSTRVANRIGVDAGAAHQAIRGFWILSALALDAFAAAAQSLVGYFAGAQELERARKVAALACQWSAGVGVVLALVMLAGSGPVAAGFVPEPARAVFVAAWWACALAQPANALAFATDGVLWGVSDYAYMRNGMLIATGIGVLGLALIDLGSPDALLQVWIVTAVWIAARAAFGLVRIWPGVGASPLRK